MKYAASQSVGTNYYVMLCLGVLGSFFPYAKFYCAVMAFALGVREISWILRSFYERGK
jgi:hypothetical protein